MDDSQMRELWALLDHQRGAQEPDLHQVLAAAVDAGMQPTIDDALLLSLRVGHRGEWVCPAFIRDFVAKLGRRRNASTVLDPWAGFGALLLSVASELNESRGVGIVSARDLAELAARLAGGASIEWRVGDPLSVLDEIEGHFDLVVSCAPIGMKAEKLTTPGEAGSCSLRDEVGLLAVAKACSHLAEDGLGIFLVGHSFIAPGRKGSVFESLGDLGLHLVGYLNVPEGALQPATNISTALVMLSKQSADGVLVGELSSAPGRAHELLDRFSTMKSSGDMATGMVVQLDDVRPFRSMAAAQLAGKLARAQGLQEHQFPDVVLSVAQGSALKERGFEETENAVYVPALSHAPAVLSQAEFTAKPQNYVQLVVRPDVVDPRFFARYLDSPIGRITRDAAMSGTFIPRLSRAGLASIVIYLPEMDAQRAVIALDDKLGGLAEELRDVRRRLWAQPRSHNDLARLLNKVNREDRFKDWLEELPFPLASILWAFHAAGNDPRTQCERLDLYFEALAEFYATVLISAFRTNESVFESEWAAISRELAQNHLSIERSSFGTWVTVAARLSKAARRLLSGKPEERELCLRLFRRSVAEPIEALCSSELPAVLQAANGHRNRWRGHGGASGEAEARSRLQTLSDLLAKSRSAMASVWNEWQLVQPLEMKKLQGVYHVTASRIMGPTTPFEKCELKLSEDPESGGLGLVGDQESSCLELLPFVRVMASPSTATNACYFFNREEKKGLRFVSYHFEAESEVTDSFPDAAKALHLLSCPPSDVSC